MFISFLYLFSFFQMDDENIYHNFLTGTLQIRPARVVDEITAFADTFRALLSTSEEDIDEFVKTTHSSNSARANNVRILIPTPAIISLKAVLFELKDRQLCNALPDQATLQGMNGVTLRVLRSQRQQALQLARLEEDAGLSTSMSVVKLTSKNYQEFETSFRALTARTKGCRGIPLDYLLRETDGNYAGMWHSRAEKLRNCASFQGPNYLQDCHTLYNLFIEHIGTTGPGSDIINQFKRSQHGRNCYLALRNHFMNATYLETKAQVARRNIRNATYHGDRRTFTLQTYYEIFSSAFNDLEYAGARYALNELQKIGEFQNGIKEPDAIRFSMQAKVEWDSLPAVEQTFDSFYNRFSSSWSTFKTLTNSTGSGNNQHHHSRIAATHSSNQNNPPSHRGGRGGRSGRGRSGRGRGRENGNGRGRGRNRQSSQYNPYQFVRQYGAFVPQAKIYPISEWRLLSQEQKNEVAQMKANAGWIDGNTPPPGFQLTPSGFAEPSTNMVNAVHSIIGAASIAPSLPPLPPAPTVGSIPPPPPPPTAPPIPPIINTEANQAGQSFGRRGTRTSSSNDSASVGMVSINGQPYSGPVYDSNNNRIA